MSASHTWLPPPAYARLRRASSASVALRLGRNPYETSLNPASKIGSKISVAAICTTRSLTAGIPSGRFFPSALSTYRRRTAFGWYSPTRSSVRSSSRKPSTPFCSICSSVSASTPAQPFLLRTRFHASHRTSRLWIRSYRAWNRRSGCRLAALHSRIRSRRTLSMPLRPPGSLVRAVPDMPSRLPASPARPPQGPFPPAALFVAAFFGTTIPSDSRCAAADFTFGLYGPPCPDSGHADGSLLFPVFPSARAAPPTPGRPPALSLPVPCAAGLAFAVK